MMIKNYYEHPDKWKILEIDVKYPKYLRDLHRFTILSWRIGN